MPSPDRIALVANALWADLYETSFRGKSRGAFVITRDQVKRLLGTNRLHRTTIALLQGAAFEVGLALVDLDGDFAAVELRTLRGIRRVPGKAFGASLSALDKEDEEDEIGDLEDADDDDDEEDIEDEEGDGEDD